MPAMMFGGIAYVLAQIGGMAEMLGLAMGAAALAIVMLGVRSFARAGRDVELERIDP